MDITESNLAGGDVVVEANRPLVLDAGRSHQERLFDYASVTEPHFLEFRLLQRLNLVQIQNELALCKSRILAGSPADEQELKTLRVTLHEYGEFNPEALLRTF
jgi:hypothetical protein